MNLCCPQVYVMKSTGAKRHPPHFRQEKNCSSKNYPDITSRNIWVMFAWQFFSCRKFVSPIGHVRNVKGSPLDSSSFWSRIERVEEAGGNPLAIRFCLWGSAFGLLPAELWELTTSSLTPDGKHRPRRAARHAHLRCGHECSLKRARCGSWCVGGEGRKHLYWERE